MPMNAHAKRLPLRLRSSGVVYLDLAGSARSIITIDSRAVRDFTVKRNAHEITYPTEQAICHFTQMWGVVNVKITLRRSTWDVLCGMGCLPQNLESCAR